MYIGTRWLLITVGTLLPACDGNSVGDHSTPPPYCPPPDSGERCTCPGSSVCPAPQLVDGGEVAVWFKCLEDGTWMKTDLSCVLGLNCRASADCMAGQACCGQTYIWPGGTQITSSSCEPTPCSADKVQLCQSSAECVQSGFVCKTSWMAFGGGSVLSCNSN
jgi:hypothetical protein